MSKVSRATAATPKMKGAGAGDGFKNVAKSVDRVPVPSSRKFTATLNRDDSPRLNLKKALDEVEGRKLKKAKTVAEITPTKSNARKPPRRHVAVGASSVLLHATPRPPVDEARAAPPPSGRLAAETRQRLLKLLVCQRMLVLVWRRNKTRLAMVSESLRRHQEQMSNYEAQVSCLKDLRQSEGHKREEVIGVNQKLENIVEALRIENSSLIAEKLLLQNQLNVVQERFEISSVELENLKNEIDTKNMYLKRLETEFHRERLQAMKAREENAVLLEKVKVQEVEIGKQRNSVDGLTENLNDLNVLLLDLEEDKRAQQMNLHALNDECLRKTRSCKSLRHELSAVAAARDELQLKISSLEDRLAAVGREYEEVLRQNETFKGVLEDRRRWWTTAREFVQVSWTVMQHAAYLMLPAL